MERTEADSWLSKVESAEDDEEVQIEEYDLTSSPNDFNIATISNFMKAGAVKIPGFQRNYVWDMKRASKLIESLIIGLPVPQIFLYEEGRNAFLVIDGQQRLMSIYYFVEGRFPRASKRVQLRRVFDEHGRIPDDVLHDDEYFEKFNLRLDEIAPNKPNRFAGRNYETLEEYLIPFQLRTIRNVIVKQNVPKDDDSSIYEMFNRLNTGGVLLTPQEIRASLYHSAFVTMLTRINMQHEWRRLLGVTEPDLHMRDIEVLLRAYAMLLDGESYGSSMAKFLNRFSQKARALPEGKVEQLEALFRSFLEASKALPNFAFFSKSNRFSVTLFESVFAAACRGMLDGALGSVPAIDPFALSALREDETFLSFSQAQSNKKANVSGRLARARKLLTVDQ